LGNPPVSWRNTTIVVDQHSETGGFGVPLPTGSGHETRFLMAVALLTIVSGALKCKNRMAELTAKYISTPAYRHRNPRTVHRTQSGVVPQRR